MTLRLTRRTDLIFENRIFTNPIILTECKNILFKKCTFTDANLYQRVAITIKSCEVVGIDECEFENNNPIYAFRSRNLNVVNNHARNINAPMPRGVTRFFIFY